MATCPDLDVEAVLADAPVKPHLRYNSKNCVRLNINEATREQLQAELMRLDEFLTNKNKVRNKAECDYKNRKRVDPAFRIKELEASRAYRTRLKASTSGSLHV